MFVDTHAHITSEFFDDIENLLIKIKNNNVAYVFNTADSLKTSYEVIELCNKFKNLKPVVGIHPTEIKDNYIEEINELENIIKNNKIYAVGEIGLDYHEDVAYKELQKKGFTLQLDLAKKYNLPVVIHFRDATQDTIDILKKYNLKGIIHCFSGSYEVAKQYIKMGFLLGIGGVVTFKNSKLYEVIEKIDLTSIVLETDSPFLSPEPYRGKKNDSSNIPIIGQKIADIKGISLEQVEEITSDNARRIFDF